MKRRIVIVLAVTVGALAVFAAAIVLWRDHDDGSDKSRNAGAEAPRVEAGSTSNISSAGRPGECPGPAMAEGSDLEVRFQNACSLGNETGMVGLVRDIARKDPALAMALAKKYCTGWRQFRACMAACARENPQAAARWTVGNMAAGGDRTFVLNTALWRWAESDPAAAFEWAAALGAEQGRSFAVRAVMTAWSRIDPKAAAAGFLAVGALPERHIVAETLAYEWARLDLRAATAWAWNIPEGPDRDGALAGIVRRLVDTGEISAGAGPSAGSETLRSLASVLGLSNESELAGALKSRISGSTPDPAFQIHFARWVINEPDDAVAWAEQLADQRVRERMLLTVAKVRSRQTGGQAEIPPEPALEQQDTVTPLPEAESQGAAPEEAPKPVEQGSGENAGSNTVGSGTEAPGPGESEPDDPAGEAGEQPGDVEDLSWQELWDLVAQLPDGEMREGLAHRAAVMQAEAGDPAAAIMMAMEQLPEGRLRDTTVRAVISAWVSADTNAPVAWARSLPEGPRREHALFSLVLSMVDTHVQEAANIALDLQAGSLMRRNAVIIVAFRWGRVNPGRATAWALGLGDSAEKELALSKIGSGGH